MNGIIRSRPKRLAARTAVSRNAPEALERRVLLTSLLDPATGSVEGRIGYDFQADGYRPPGDVWLTTATPYFLDADADGVRDSGEVGGSRPGAFAFSGLQPGRYTLRLAPPPGWVADPVAPAVDVVGGETARFPDVRLRPSDEPGSVAGTLFYDDDLDGALDPGEQGMPGAGVYLDLNANNRRDAADLLTVTDFHGRYKFTGLAAGTYPVRFVVTGCYAVSPAVKSVTFDGATPAGPVDFGFTLFNTEAHVTGRVYRDNDGDGAFDASVDTPVPNVVVFSDDRNNDRFDASEPMGLTDAAGRYGFNVPAGTQEVRVALPPGWAPAPGETAAAAVQLKAMQVATLPDFRLVPADGSDAPAPAAISGVVFDDLDVDGVRDPFEADVFTLTTNRAAPRVYLDSNGDGSLGAGEPSVGVDVRGHFAFGSLPAGRYAVRIAPQTGFAQTKPWLSALAVDAAAGVPPTPVELGLAYAPASVSGEVYLDANANGRRDEGEAPAPFLAVALDTNRNGTFDDPADKTTFTEVTGAFSFTGLTPGEYGVALAGNARYVQSEPAGGAPIRLSVAPLEKATGLRLGAARWGGSLAGTYFYDANRNGTRDPLESRQGYGLSVRAEDVNDPTRSWTTRSGNDGAWSLDVPAGTYRVTGETGGNSVPSGTTERVVSVAVGQDVGDIDFGFRARGVRVEGVVYNDANGSGVRDAGEAGLPGIVVTAGGPGPAGNVVTDAEGRYAFDDLDPGVWSVGALAPPRMLGGRQFFTVVVMNPGEVGQVNPIALYTPTSNYISGIVFEDLNGNGRRDEGEPPRPGILVAFDQDQDGVFDFGDPTALSDEQGWYAFARFDPRGQYRLRLLPGADSIPTSPAEGEWVTVAGGDPTESYPDVDLGYRRRPPAFDAHVFYNNSAYDGAAAGTGAADAGAADDAAVAPDKRPMLRWPAGESVELTHSVTNYSRGLNGVMVDLGARAAGAAPPTLDDFVIKAGNTSDPAAWPLAGARPEIITRARAGTLLSDRVTLTFADGAIRNTWLEVTVLPGERTGLLTPQTFYFGNLAGDTGDSATSFRVNALDLGRVKRALNSSSPVTGPFDFNRDGKVSALDLGVMKANLNRSLAAPAAPAPVPAAARVAAPLQSAPAADVAGGATPRRVWDETDPQVL